MQFGSMLPIGAVLEVMASLYVRNPVKSIISENLFLFFFSVLFFYFFFFCKIHIAFISFLCVSIIFSVLWIFFILFLHFFPLFSFVSISLLIFNFLSVLFCILYKCASKCRYYDLIVMSQWTDEFVVTNMWQGSGWFIYNSFLSFPLPTFWRDKQK